MYKKIVSLLLIFCMIVLLAGCGSDKTMTHEKKNGQRITKEYRQYGLFDENQFYDKNVKYRLVVGNIVWSVILSETFIVPLILIGWYLYEPVGFQDNIDE